jgi:hypothetical protein
MSELKEFAENVSMIDGPPVRMLGLSLATRMIIVKLSGGSLWVNSPVSVPIQVLDRIFSSKKSSSSINGQAPLSWAISSKITRLRRLSRCLTLFGKSAGLPIRTVAFRSTSDCLSRIGSLRGDRSGSCFRGISTS